MKRLFIVFTVVSLIGVSVSVFVSKSKASVDLVCFNNRADWTNKVWIESNKVTANGFVCNCFYDSKEGGYTAKWYRLSADGTEGEYVRSGRCINRAEY